MKRLRYLPLVFVVLFLDLVTVVHPARAAGSLAVSAWTCPAGVDPTGADPAIFAATCLTEAPGLTFALTVGELTRRRETAPARPASWPIVSGPFTLALETPLSQPAVVFCQSGGTSQRFDAPTGQIEAELTGETGWECRWYLLPASTLASPQAQSGSPAAVTPTSTSTATATATVPATATAFPTSTPPATATTPPTPTAVPTTAPTATQLPTQTPFPTSTPAPTATPQPTATIVPTVAATATATPSPTTTSTPNSRATATAVASAIAVATPAYELPFHSLTYPRGDALKVYPDPGDEEDVGFDVEDFVVDVTFVNPEPGPDETWDYGILFGPTDKNEYYRVYARADGRWFVDLGDETLREGEARRLDLNDGEANTFRLIVSDSRGILFINDRYVGSFELGSGSSQRTVWLATTNLDGRDLAFRDLSIWSFP